MSFGAGVAARLPGQQGVLLSSGLPELSITLQISLFYFILQLLQCGTSLWSQLEAMQATQLMQVHAVLWIVALVCPYPSKAS